MVPNPYGLYDDGVRARTLWAVREGLVVGGIVLFWVGIAVALSVVLLVLSVPFAITRFGTPGLPVAGLVWTLVGPLAFLNASLYVLVRAGTVVVDHHRTGDGLTFEPASRSDERDERSGSKTGERSDGSDAESSDTANGTD